MTKLFLGGFLWLLTACAGISDLSHANYQHPVFFLDDLAGEHMAVLPMAAPKKYQPYQAAAEAMFYRVLVEMRPALHTLSPEATLKKIQESGLTPLYDTFRQNSALFQKMTQEQDLTQLKAALATRFLLQTRLDQIEVVEGATHIRILGRLFDMERGDILWEGTGESRGYLFLFLPRVPANFEKAIEVASRGFVRTLPQ